MARKKNFLKNLISDDKGKFSKKAFWFSMLMGISCLTLISSIIAHLGFNQPVDFKGLATLLGAVNSISAGAYVWGKKIEKEG